MAGTRAPAFPAVAFLIKELLQRNAAAACVAFGVLVACPHLATQEPEPADRPPPVEFGLPSPPEYFLALSKQLNPRWRNLYQPVPVLGRPDRRRAAMVLGAIVTDTYLAIETRDSQRVRNLTQDMRRALTVLGLAGKAEARLQRIADTAQREDWAQARWEVEGGGPEFAAHFAELRDDDLHRLALLGAWIRALETGSRAVKQSGKPEHGPWCVGDPGLLDALAQVRDSLSEPTRKLDFIEELRLEIGRLQKRWKTPDGPPTMEDIEATLVKLANYEKRTYTKP